MGNDRIEWTSDWDVRRARNGFFAPNHVLTTIIGLVHDIYSFVLADTVSIVGSRTATVTTEVDVSNTDHRVMVLAEILPPPASSRR